MAAALAFAFVRVSAQLAAAAPASLPLTSTPVGAFANSARVFDPRRALGDNGVATQVWHSILPDSVTLLLLALFISIGYMTSQADIAEFAEEQDNEKETSERANLKSETHCAKPNKPGRRAPDFAFKDGIGRLPLFAPLLAVLVKLSTPRLLHSLEDPWRGMAEVHGMALKELSTLANIATDPWIPTGCIAMPLLWLLGLIGIACIRADILDFIAAEEAKDNVAMQLSKDGRAVHTCTTEGEDHKRDPKDDKPWEKQSLATSTSRLYSVLLVPVVLASPLFFVLGDLALAKSTFGGVPWIRSLS